MEDDDFDIGALLGGPVRAIQEAQIAAEREYMAFLLDYGLEETKNGLRLREISFAMNRTISDPSAPGEVIETEAEIKAPLLSLVQMPAVGIEEATIALDLDVTTQGEESEQSKGNVTTKPTPSKTVTNRLLPLSRAGTPVMKGSVANSTSSRNFRTRGKLSVKMTLRATHDDDLHGRLARLISEGLSTTADVPD